MGVSSGKPPYLSTEQRAILSETITTKVLADLSFSAKYNWTLTILVQWVEREWKGSYSLRGMSKLLTRMGFSHTRPTCTLGKADAEKQAHFINETFPALKKLLHEEINHILFQDESMICDDQAIQKTWFLKGKQRIVPTYEKHQGVKLIGTLNYETGEVFLSFLEKVLAYYLTEKIVVILDNAKIHHAKRIPPFYRLIKNVFNSYSFPL